VRGERQKRASEEKKKLREKRGVKKGRQGERRRNTGSGGDTVKRCFGEREGINAVQIRRKREQNGKRGGRFMPMGAGALLGY